MNDSLNTNNNGFRAPIGDQQLAELTTPVYVPLTQNPDDETFQQKLERYTKFEVLPETVKFKLVEPKTSQKIQLIGRKYNFDVLRLANITRLIREYYFGETRLEDFPREIEKRMEVSFSMAQEITNYLRSEIIGWNAWAEYLSKLPKILARELVAKYPQAAEREITNDYIEFKDRPDQIFDPSIKNWLRDYLSYAGQNNHSDFERMNYLFHTKNTEKLSSQEREKLGIILKSFDENIPLAIDTETQEVVFEDLAGPVMRNTKPETKIKESSFIRPYQPIRETHSPTYPPTSKKREQASPQFATQNIISQQPAIKPPLPPAIQPTRPPEYPKIDHSFRPEVAKPKQSSQNLGKNSTFPPRETSFQDPSKPSLPPMPDNLQFYNPYPTPGKHEVKFDQIAVPPREMQKDAQGLGQAVARSTLASQQNAGSPDQSPIKVKGFTEKQSVQPKKEIPAAPPKKSVYTPPSRPKNVFYPHNYFAEKEEKPEVIIDGNTVDLSGQQ